jgi:hypothetical protein
MINNFKKYLLIESKTYSQDEAKKIGDSLSVDWKKYDLEQFRMGLEVESEHDDGSDLDVVNSKAELAKIVLAHLKEMPNYYTKLKKMEEDAPANSVGTGAGVAGLTEPVGKKSVIQFTKRKGEE